MAKFQKLGGWTQQKFILSQFSKLEIQNQGLVEYKTNVQKTTVFLCNCNEHTWILN